MSTPVESRLLGQDRVVITYNATTRKYLGCFYVRKSKVAYKTKTANTKTDVQNWVYEEIRPEYPNCSILDDCFD
jgi:hypothetical protein